jgi:uncharacterized protein (TIGR00730 family)
MRRILVYCGANVGTNPIYAETAIELGKTFVGKNIRLIYGGGNVGLMGELSRAVMDNGGKATGVIPDFLVKMEVANPNLTEMITVETMHQRKAKMVELCEGVITLPGGFGSMDELFEMLTWAQLGLHQKPIGILNVNGFYDHLINQIDFMVVEGFLRKENRELLVVDDTIEGLLQQMEDFKPHYHLKWLEKSKV